MQRIPATASGDPRPDELLATALTRTTGVKGTPKNADGAAVAVCSGRIVSALGSGRAELTAVPGPGSGSRDRGAHLSPAGRAVPSAASPALR